MTTCSSVCTHAHTYIIHAGCRAHGNVARRVLSELILVMFDYDRRGRLFVVVVGDRAGDDRLPLQVHHLSEGVGGGALPLGVDALHARRTFAQTARGDARQVQQRVRAFHDLSAFFGVLLAQAKKTLTNFIYAHGWYC